MLSILQECEVLKVRISTEYCVSRFEYRLTTSPDFFRMLRNFRQIIGLNDEHKRAERKFSITRKDFKLLRYVVLKRKPSKIESVAVLHPFFNKNSGDFCKITEISGIYVEELWSPCEYR